MLADALNAIELVDDAKKIFSLPQPFSVRKTGATIIYASQPNHTNRFTASWSTTNSRPRAYEQVDKNIAGERAVPAQSIEDFVAGLLAQSESKHVATPLQSRTPSQAQQAAPQKSPPKGLKAFMAKASACCVAQAFAIGSALALAACLVAPNGGRRAVTAGELLHAADARGRVATKRQKVLPAPACPRIRQKALAD